VGGEIHLECKLFPALGSKLKIDIIGREFRMASAIENQLGFIGSRYDIAALYAFGSRAGEISEKVYAKELNLLEDIEDSLTTKEKFTANFELVI